MLEAGELSDIYHFRGRYLQEWGDIDDQVALRPGRRRLGSARRPRGARDRPGALPRRRDRVRSGTTRTFKEGREVDDAFEAVVGFEGGAVGTLEASRFCPGARTLSAGRSTARRARSRSTSSGSTSSGAPGRHRSGRACPGVPDGARVRGRPPLLGALVAARSHDRLEHSFVHELHHFLTAIAENGDVAPHGATLEDGYRAAEVCDAVVRSSESGRREEIAYR